MFQFRGSLMQCWDHFRRWKWAPHGSKLFWRFGVSIFHVNNDRDIFGPGLCSMLFFLGYVFLKECSHRAVSWVRLGFFQIRKDSLQPPIQDNFNKVSIFFDCTRTLETKISFPFFCKSFHLCPGWCSLFPTPLEHMNPCFCADLLVKHFFQHRRCCKYLVKLVGILERSCCWERLPVWE